MSDIAYVTGLVVVEDGIKKSEEYAPARKVRVEINFGYPVEANAAPYLDRAAALANAKVQELLGMPIVEITQRTVGGSVIETPTETIATGDAKLPKARKTKAAEPAGESAEVKAERERLAAELDLTPAESTDIELDDEFTVGPEDTTSLDELTTAPPAEVTDADLNAAVQKKNGEIKDPVAIRTLIGTYNPDPKKAFQLREIKQADRAGFIAKLGELKKA